MIDFLNDSVYVQNELNNAKMRLTAPEVDLFVLLATKVKGNNYQNITVTYEELRTLYGDSRVHYKHLRPIFQGLMNNIIEVYDTHTKKYINCVLVTRIDFQKSSGFAVFYLDMFVANLLQYIKNNSTIFQLRTVLSLRSVHAKRIYMLASQFKKSGIWSIPVMELKDKLGLIDHKEGKELYKNYADFRKRVLDQAVKEINDKAEFKIELNPVKRGKEVERISAIIYIKSISEEVKLSDNAKRQVSRLRAGGVSDWQIENILFEASEELINKILYSFDLTKGTISNPGGWLTSAFERQGVEMRKKLIDTKQLDLVEEAHKISAA